MQGPVAGAQGGDEAADGVGARGGRVQEGGCGVGEAVVGVQQPKFLDGGMLVCREGAAEHAEDVGGERESGERRREGRGGAVAVGDCDDEGEGRDGGGDLGFDC